MRAEMEGSKVSGDLQIRLPFFSSRNGSGPPRYQRLNLAKMLISSETPNVKWKTISWGGNVAHYYPGCQ